MASTYGAPEWVQPMVVALLLAGFPIAIILAWAFEVTPDGLRPTGPEESKEVVGSGVRFAIIGGSLLSALVFAGALSYFYLTPSDQIVIEIVRDRPPSIAVLPFVDMSEDGDQEYFGDGLAEELLDELSRADGLRVIARTSSFQFKGRNDDIRNIGEALDVSYVLEGSIRKAGLRLRITAQLIDVADGSHIWSEQFDRNLDDIFAIQDEIASAIAGQLRVSLLGRTERHEPSVALYEQYLMAKSLSEKSSQDTLSAISILEAIALEDPDFVDARILLARLYVYNTIYGLQDTVTEYTRMVPHLNHVLALEPDNAPALLLQSWLGWSQTGSFSEFVEISHSLNQRFPDDPEILAGNLWGFLDFPDPELDEAFARLCDRLLSIDPLNIGFLRSCGVASYLAGNMEEARRQWQFAADLGDRDEYIHQSYLFYLALKNEEIEEAREIVDRLTEIRPRNSPHLMLRRLEIAVVEGDLDTAAQLEADLDSLRSDMFFTPGIMFLANAALGREERAINFLEEGINMLDEAAMHSFGFLDLDWPPYGKSWNEIARMKELRERAFGVGTAERMIEVLLAVGAQQG